MSTPRDESSEPIGAPAIKPGDRADARALGEHLEWLDARTPDSPPAGEERSRWRKKAAEAGARAVPGRRCPQCGWLDAVTRKECFRCAKRFDLAAEALEALAERDLRPPPTRVVVESAGDLLTARVEPFRIADLRYRAAERALLPGFNRLLGLGHINREVVQDYPFQREAAIRALRDMGGQALLADETGLGKTIEAGLVMKELIVRGLVRSVLVIVPAALTEQWREELHEKFLEEFVVARTEKQLRNAERIITTYATVRSAGGPGRLLRERSFDLLVVDEAHKLKNRATQQHQAINRIPRKYVLLLSATPFHNNLGELRSLIDVIKPGLLGSGRTFNKQFVDPKDPRRPRRVAHLRRLLDEVMIRRRRTEVNVELPPRRAAVYHVKPRPVEQAFYEQLTRLVGEEIHRLQMMGDLVQRTAGDRRYSWVLALITLQREACSSPPAVEKTLRKLASQTEGSPENVTRQLGVLADEASRLPLCRKAAACHELLDGFEGQFVIFVEYLATADYLKRSFEGEGITTTVYHGGLDDVGRKATLDRFRAGEARVMIATRTGGEGLNVQFCHNLINYDLPWNPMSVEQRIGRLHRLGQEHPVSVFNLSVEGTVEARVLELLTHKIKLFTAVLGEVDLILGNLHSERSFEQILRQAWLEGTQSGGLDRAFDEFGHELERARTKYDDIKDSESKLSEIFEDQS